MPALLELNTTAPEHKAEGITFTFVLMLKMVCLEERVKNSFFYSCESWQTAYLFLTMKKHPIMIAKHGDRQ